MIGIDFDFLRPRYYRQVEQIDRACFAEDWFDFASLASEHNYNLSGRVAVYGYGVAVGFMLVRRLPACRRQIVRLGVMPAWRGMGIGGQLVADAIRLAEESRYRTVEALLPETAVAELNLLSHWGLKESALVRCERGPDLVRIWTTLTAGRAEAVESPLGKAVRED